jgi:mono/diheme cytochrome c family protein
MPLILDFMMTRTSWLWVCEAGVCIATVLIGHEALRAAETMSAQVAGFDRFGRHGEIDETLAGRLLITELGCSACHTTKDETLKPKPGPDLSGVGVRLHHDWVASFVADPATAKPGTTMPNLLDSLPVNERRDAAESIAAYLSSLRKPYAEIKATGRTPAPHQFWLRGDVGRGRELFHQVGCVACHAADPNHEAADVVASPTDQLLELLDEDELAELGLSGASRPGPIQSLGDPATKYSAYSLARFLLEPAVARPSGRMPNLNLLPTEAADIAAYLISQRSLMPPTKPTVVHPDGESNDLPSAEAVAKGREWFTQLKCGNCHGVTDVKENKALATISPLNRLSEKVGLGSGCTGSREKLTNKQYSPVYKLDEVQRSAIVAAIGSSSTLQAAEKLKLSMLQLNCLACHQRDALGGVARDRRAYFETVGNVDLGDEGRFPPPLTRAEAKLQPAWLTRVLQGNGAIRPHMYVRMPKLPNDLVKSFSNEFRDATPKSSATSKAKESSKPAPTWPQMADTKATDVGRVMMDSGCVQCHLFRGESLPGVVGVDLSGIGDRMQPEWFLALLRDPGAVKPRTRMPNFFPEGKSQHPDLLNGEPDRQIAAMWGYLNNLASESLPAKIEEARAADYELRPVDRPIILRTFMRDAGTHAIAVGFPQSIHFAIDTTNARLATVWRGRFLDAQGTWFVRSAPPADPLGDAPKTLSSLPTFIIPQDSKNSSSLGIATPFRGYRLNDKGVPTFLYRFGSIDIEDTMEPDLSGDGGFVRRLVAKPAVATKDPTQMKSPLFFRLLSGRDSKTVSNSGDKENVEFTNEAGWRVRVAGDIHKMTSMRLENGIKSWLLPIDLRQGEMVWEVRYSW